MELYDKLVDEGRDYLNAEFVIRNSELNSSEVPYNLESGLQNEELEGEFEERTVEENQVQDDYDLDFMLNLQEAFDNEDWLMYSILVQEIKTNESNSGLLKQIDMACKMINADFTTDEEKEEAIKYIKEHHSEIMEI